ncbi:MAG: GWxTD domain-containing protein [Bacteroidota bacterium]
MNQSKFLKSIAFLFLLTFLKMSAQTDIAVQEKKQFYFDAIAFKSDTADASGKPLQRVDVFVVVPYQNLQFISVGSGMLGAQYTVVVSARDSANVKVSEQRLEKKLTEKDYGTTRGQSGSIDYSQVLLKLPSGNYTIDVLVIDALSKQESFKNRKIAVPDFSRYEFGVSGIMLVSAIEQRAERYIITPHIADNVAGLTEGFFAFFETYNRAGRDSADFVYEIVKPNGDVVFKSAKARKDVSKTQSQQFLKITPPATLETASYTLRLIALKLLPGEEFTRADYISLSERTLNFERTISGTVLTNLDKSIRQMRYVADQSEIDFIEAGATNGERAQRLEEFWRKLDPTPNTPRNEAFEDYYARIEYANRMYRSYTEGWLTDMGMIYIIFGPPSNAERQQVRSDGREAIRWTYQNSRQFLFVDNTGFGDFRLTTPISPLEKYRYGR